MNAHAAESRFAPLNRKELAILAREINLERMQDDITRYAANPQLESRHADHDGNVEAVRLLTNDLRTIGTGRFWSRRQRFVLRKDDPNKKKRENVEAMLPGMNSDEVVIVAAHLDCTAERDPSYRPGKDPSPGADDDASGISGVLAAARAIRALAAAQGAGERRAEIRFVLFNAEELGQRGSRVYARRQARMGTPITAVYQMDMIGFRHRRRPEFELHAGFRRNPVVQAASLEIADHLARVCAAANIPLTPQVYFHRPKNRDPGQGFSDHTSFHRRGYPAISICENFFPGPGNSQEYPNPDYHMPEDTICNLDPIYAMHIARAVTGAAWHWATRSRCACGPPSAAASEHSHESSVGHADAHLHELAYLHSHPRDHQDANAAWSAQAEHDHG